MYDSHEYPRFIAAIARSMLWYPIGKSSARVYHLFETLFLSYTAYVILMFPHLVTCLLHASGFKVSDTGRVITAATSALLGARIHANIRLTNSLTAIPRSCQCPHLLQHYPYHGSRF